jgi:hypothetical protein
MKKMDSLHTGSDELIYVQTDKVSIIIKGRTAHSNIHQEYTPNDSALKVFCKDRYEVSLNGCKLSDSLSENKKSCFGIYSCTPIFYEQHNYEIIIEADDAYEIDFWHDNYNIRNKVTRASRQHNIFSGIINFGNEIGLSDLVIKLKGEKYLCLVIEVFPTKIDYKEDYKNIVVDVTREVYNLVFDFLKKTYISYRQGDHVNNSPVEFFAVIRQIYSDFIRAIDVLLARPHHILEKTYEVLPEYKVKRIDHSTMRWIEKHQERVCRSNHTILVERALSVRKQITYDTKENRLTKYMLQQTIKRLTELRRNYQQLQRDTDMDIVKQIDRMIQGLNRRCNSSFLAGVNAHEGFAGMSLVFSLAPGYRDLYKYYLMLLRGLSIHGDVFNISVKDLALLYEYWCFIKLNSLLKDRYELISQDIIKTQGNGLFVSLVKGNGSHVKYRNVATGEVILLSYNPKAITLPTVTQRPDNVLSLQKKGTDIQYEYVFDAKYRINLALPESGYFKAIDRTPGPEVDDINTMHRYRDAIVYRNGADPFQRTMFGAYVLFPYTNEVEYRSHRFYKSIDEVNIGGLPFLPSATSLVADMLDELVADSPDSAFERATLPRGIEDKLKKIDWSVRDVLIGSLSNPAQLNICQKYCFYHIPVSKLDESSLPIHYVAIYQSKRMFGKAAGIRYYGEVTKCIPVKRSAILETPRNSDEAYYRLEVKEWNVLSKPIKVKEAGFVRILTNLFLLLHSSEVPELLIRSEEEYRLYSELKRIANHASIAEEDSNIGFEFEDGCIAFLDGNINVHKNGVDCGRYTIEHFSKYPRATIRQIRSDMNRCRDCN